MKDKDFGRSGGKACLRFLVLFCVLLCSSLFPCGSDCYSENVFGQSPVPQSAKELPEALRKVYRRIQSGAPNTQPTDSPSVAPGNNKNPQSSVPLPSPVQLQESPGGHTTNAVSHSLPPFEFPFPAPDRGSEDLLRRATAFAHAGRWAEAIPGLQDFLERDTSCFWYDGTAKAMVRRLIDSSPAQAKKMYELLYEPSARLALQRMAKEGNFDLAAKNGYAYRQTPSGQTMLFLAGRDCYAKGRSLESLVILRELGELPFEQTIAMEPDLTVLLVSTLVHWGYDEEAQARLVEFFRCVKRLQLTETISFSSPGEVLKFLHEKESGSIKDFAKAALDNTSSQACVGWSERMSFENASVFHGGRLLGQTTSGRISSAFRPVVHGDDLVVRRCMSLELRNALTGELKWSSLPLEPVLPGRMAEYYSFAYEDGAEAASEIWNASGPWLAFHDRTSGTAVLDSQRVYTVEFPCRVPTLNQAVYVSNQKRTLPLIRADQGNTITARDRQTGKVIWSLGQIPYFEEYLDFVLDLAQKESSTQVLSDDDFSKRVEALRESLVGETYFCGAPLLLDGRLYLIGRQNGIYSLYTVAAEQGTVIAKTPLMLTGGAPCAVPTPIMAGMTPIVCEGVILCPLPGMLVAVTQSTGEILWCWYDRKNKAANAVSGAGGVRDLFDGVVNMPGGMGRVWLGIAGRRIFYSSLSAPNTILCITPDKGRVVWEKSFPELSFVVSSPNELVVISGNAVIQLNPVDGQVIATATIPQNRYAAGDGMIDAGILYIPLDDGSIAKTVLATTPNTILNVEMIRSGLPEGGNLNACRNGILIASPEWLAVSPKQGKDQKSKPEAIRPIHDRGENLALLPPLKSDRPSDRACTWSNMKRFEFETRPRVGKEPLPSDLPILIRPKGRELAVCGKECACLTNIRFYLSDDETQLMIFDEFNTLTSQIPIPRESGHGQSATLLRKETGSQPASDIDPRHRFVLTDEGVFLICDRISKDRFVVRFAQHDRYTRSKDRDIRTIHSERRGLEAEWNAWYRELGLDVCVIDPFVVWFDSYGVMTTINLLSGQLRRLSTAGTNAKFVRMFAADEKLYALVLEFQSRLGSNGKRQVVRQWRLEERSLDDGRVVGSAPLPYTPVFQTGAILLGQSSTDSKFKQIVPAECLESYRENRPAAEGKKSDQASVPKREAADGTRDLAIANDTVFRLVRNENLVVLRLQEGRLIVLDTRNGSILFQSGKEMKALAGRPVDYEVWRDGKDWLILYRLGGLYPEPNDSTGPLTGLADKPVSRGQIMRYSSDGKELWPEYITVERTFLFDRQLDMLPCLLLGKTDSDEDGSSWRAVMAIDKRSGVYAFRAKIPVPTSNANGGVVPLQGTFFVNQAKRALSIVLDEEYRFYFKTQEKTETNHGK